MPEELSTILITIDSLNRHFLPCYGNDWVQAPVLTDFARRAAVFDNHHIGSAPCMPARRELWTGTEEMWWRFWGPLEPWDRPIAYLARQVPGGEPAPGIATHLVTDHYHLFEWGSHSYNYDFHGYDYVRGHEFDNWRTDPVSEVPDWATQMIERRSDSWIYLRNAHEFRREEDFFGPRVMQATADWLDRNHERDRFFLQVDSFDVHEPFHVPEPYRSMYSDADYRRFSPWPLYGRVDGGRSELSDEEIEWVRAQYAGKITMIDRWLERVFDRLDRHHLWDRTCVIISTDHGHFLGDHGWMGKPAAPLYHTISHIPLMIWHPDGAHNGQRISATTQTVDLYATTLDMLGLPVPDVPNVHSRSLAPLLAGKSDTHRSAAVYGYHGKRVGITAGDWSLLRYHDPSAAPVYQYTSQVEQVDGFGFPNRSHRRFSYPNIEAGRFIPGVDMPVWRVPLATDWAETQDSSAGDMLFHNPSDPTQERNLAAERPDVVREMEERLRLHLTALQAPEEQFRRLKLR